jgi:hypothetical protein
MKVECKRCGVGSDIKSGEGCCTEWRCKLCMLKQTYCLMIDLPPRTVVFEPFFELGDKNDYKEKDGEEKE